MGKQSLTREAVFLPEFREDLRYRVETDGRSALRIFKLVSLPFILIFKYAYLIRIYLESPFDA